MIRTADKNNTKPRATASLMKVYNISAEKGPCGLHACLRHIMRLGRWAGCFPIQGLGQRSTDEIKFNVKCFYTIYPIATVIGQVFMTCFSLIYFFDGDVSLSSISNVLFYLTSLIATILFIRMAQNWPRLMKVAEETERSLTMLKLDSRTISKSTAIAYLIMALALVEHLLCINFNVKFIMECLHEPIINNEVLANYVLRRMPYIFNYISYSVFNAVFIELLCMQATFLWSFTDVMTICFSVYITSYFYTFNKLIYSKKINNNVSWGQLRDYYSKLSALVKEIDDQLSSFILLSFFTDLFFICLQLFNSLHRNQASFKDCGEEEIKRVLSSPDYLLYYLYSFLFLVLRALFLSLFAANVHAAAQEPIFAIYDVPSSEYDQEVERFQSQVHFTQIGLTGIFFCVTRNTILHAIGTILTYELVLLQFNTAPDKVTSLGTINNNNSTIIGVN